MTKHDPLRPLFALALAALAALATSRTVYAGCNVVPSAGTLPRWVERFDGWKGFLDRPFAPPSTKSIQETIAIGLRSCDAVASVNFATTDAFPGSTKDYVVTLAFKPVGRSGAATLMVLAEGDCNDIPEKCGGQDTHCTLSTFAIAGTGAQRQFKFGFPSSAGLTGAAMPELGGPVAIAVTPRGARAKTPCDDVKIPCTVLPCGLAAKPCNQLPCDLVSAAACAAPQSKATACVDELFDTPCGSGKHATFPTFAALPPPNVYKEKCWSNVGPCTSAGGDAAIAVDAIGNLLVPLEWDAITPSSASQMRAVRGWTQHRDRLHDVQIPDEDYAAAVYSPEGHELIPKVTVGHDRPGIVAPNHFVESTTYTVLRISRFACAGDKRKRCASDAECPTSRCEALTDFDFSGIAPDGVVRFARESHQLVCQQSSYRSCKASPRCGTGVYCKGYVMEADANPVGTKTGVRTGQLIGHVSDEAEDGRDRNGDSDPSDLVLELRDVDTGTGLGLAQAAAPVKKKSAPGKKAGMRAHAFPLVRTGIPGVPAVDAAESVVAFLESDATPPPPAGGASPGAGMLRVLARVQTNDGTPVLEDRAAGLTLPADAALLVNGQSLVVSGDHVFYRALRPGAAVPELAVLETMPAPVRVASAATHGGVPFALASARDAAAGPVTLGPASMVAVAGGNAAFLRPTGGDGSVSDGEVWRWTPTGGAESLGRRATEVALSPAWIAARVTAPGHGHALAVHPVAAGGWTDVVAAVASGLQVTGSVVAFRTSGDLALRLYDAGAEHVIKVYRSAEDFVLSEPGAAKCSPKDSSGHQFVAFRTREAAHDRDLNRDGDRADTVLQVYDVTARAPVDLLGPPPSAEPCTVGACDPRVPYRIAGSQVRFLTRECEQNGSVRAGCPTGGTDLNGDGDASDLVVQVLDVCAGRVTPIAEVAVEALGTSADPITGEDGSLFFPSHAGRCETNACTAPGADGKCILSTPSTCLTDASCGSGASCAPEVLTLAVAMGDDDRDGIPNGVDASPQLADVSSSAGPEKRGFFCKLFPGCSCCRGRR